MPCHRKVKATLAFQSVIPVCFSYHKHMYPRMEKEVKNSKTKVGALFNVFPRITWDVGCIPVFVLCAFECVCICVQCSWFVLSDQFYFSLCSIKRTLFSFSLFAMPFSFHHSFVCINNIIWPNENVLKTPINGIHSKQVIHSLIFVYFHKSYKLCIVRSMLCVVYLLFMKY